MKSFLLASVLHFFAPDTIPPQYQLFQSLRHYYVQKTAADIAEFQIIGDYKKMTWKDYLPSVGVGYNLQGNPVPTLQYSISEKSELKKKRAFETALREAKIESIRLSAAIAFFNDSLNLVSLIERSKILRGGLETIKKTYALEKRIFDIQKEKYKQKQITDIELMNFERQYLEFEQRFNNANVEVELIEIEVLKAAKWVYSQ